MHSHFSDYLHELRQGIDSLADGMLTSSIIPFGMIIKTAQSLDSQLKISNSPLRVILPQSVTGRFDYSQYDPSCSGQLLFDRPKLESSPLKTSLPE